MSSLSPTLDTKTSKPLRVALWIAQVILAVMFCFAGFMKLTTPIAQLSAMMPWTGQFPELFVRVIGAVDLAGGIGILLPAATRILPRLTVLAALGCSVLQVFAIAFHVSRGEFNLLALNFVLLPLALFVLWGRARKAPIASRL
jgi:uncharacterized membrane protein YphA (DoxX/SURF4 family)